AERQLRGPRTLARLGDGAARGGRGWRAARRVRADRPGPAGSLFGGRRPCRCAVRGSGRVSTGRGGGVPATARLLADAGTRTATRGRARHRPTAMSGGPFRLIHGGRSEESTPGPRTVDAAEGR